MREIKYRGKPIWKGGIWLHGIGAYKSNTAEHLIINAKGDCVEVVNLCQYTGLKDRNGKEIYEGDIIKTPLGHVGIVQFGKAVEYCTHKEWGRMITDAYTTYGWIFDGKIKVGIDDEILKGEVIGNIHDNKELLEEESK